MKTKCTLPLLLALLAVVSGFAQNLKWVSTSAGNQQMTMQVSEHVWDVEASATDVFVTGYITGSEARFGTIIMADERNHPNLGDTYSYLACYDVNGNARWVKRISLVYETDLALDADNNVWIAYTNDLGVGFIRKYTSNGDLVLEKQLQINTDVELTSISTDHTGAVIVTGLLHANKTAVTVEGKEYTGIFGDSYISYALEGFVMKYDQDQTFEWFSLTKGSDACQINDAQVDSENNIILVGTFTTEENKQLRFGPDIKLSTYTIPGYSTSRSSGFLAKVSPEGNFIWAENLQSQADSWANGITINQGNEIFAVGTFSGTAAFKENDLTSKGSNDVFFTKLNTDGDVMWLKSAGGNLYSNGDFGRSIVVDKHDNLFLSGSFVNSATFGEGDAAITLKTLATYDRGGFLAQFDPEGNIVWAEELTGTSGSKAEAQALALNEATLYAGGFFYKEASLFDTQLPVAYTQVDHVFLAAIDVRSTTVTALPEAQLLARSVIVYPNPTVGRFTVKMHEAPGNLKHLQVINATGKIILSAPMYASEHTLDLSIYPPGLYTLVIKTDKHTIIKRVVKL